MQNVFLTVIPAKNEKTVGQEKIGARIYKIKNDHPAGMSKEYSMRELT